MFARNMVKQYGTSILNVLDSPSAATKLTACQGIGSKFALMIKHNWDESRGTLLPTPLSAVAASFSVLLWRYRSVVIEIWRLRQCVPGRDA